jgi:hypothetical protein
VPRVPAHEIESMVVDAVRARLHQDGRVEAAAPETDRDLIEREVRRVIIKLHQIEIELVGPTGGAASERLDDDPPLPECNASRVLCVSWTGATGTAVKGVVHSPATREIMLPANRDELLLAIAKARAWVEDLVDGRTTSFAEIAEREGKVERHVRFLAPLAFVSPRMVHSIAEGSFRGDLNVTKLVKLIDCSWVEQERSILGRA